VAPSGAPSVSSSEAPPGAPSVASGCVTSAGAVDIAAVAGGARRRPVIKNSWSSSSDISGGNAAAGKAGRGGECAPDGGYVGVLGAGTAGGAFDAVGSNGVAVARAPGGGHDGGLGVKAGRGAAGGGAAAHGAANAVAPNDEAASSRSCVPYVVSHATRATASLVCGAKDVCIG